jgi:hypothetical protein
MASLTNAVICALIATSFWGLIGYALAHRLLPRPLALGAGPVIGWSVNSALTLPIYLLLRFSSFAVIAVGSVCILFAGLSLLKRSTASETKSTLTIPVWAFVAAGVLAMIPAATLLPKSSGDAVWLADATFDHAKIAIIDAMTRLGLPPVNPVFAEAGQPAHLASYYLWHFSAAEVALVTSMTGWEADIGLTWFTAAASLSLMMGLAVWLSKRSSAAFLVVVLAAAVHLLCSRRSVHLVAFGIDGRREQQSRPARHHPGDDGSDCPHCGSGVLLAGCAAPRSSWCNSSLRARAQPAGLCADDARQYHLPPATT